MAYCPKFRSKGCKAGRHLLWPVAANLFVLEIFLHIHQERLHLLRRPKLAISLPCFIHSEASKKKNKEYLPPHRLRKQPRHHPLQTRRQVLQLKRPGQLQLLTLRPLVARDLVLMLPHAPKPVFTEPARVPLGVVDGRAEALRGGGQQVGELAQGPVGGERRVVAGDGAGDALQLDPAARFEVVVDLVDQAWPVADGQEEVARKDVVERARLPGPVLLDVVELELAVGWDPGRELAYTTSWISSRRK